ncbi:MAG: flagellar type III secretion system pore protein FliP [Oscillospiraceae bacterium]
MIALLGITTFATNPDAVVPIARNQSPVTINFNNGTENGRAFGIVDMMGTLLLLALLPSILVMMTSFTRIIIVLSFLRNALGTQQSPPNQVLIGLALFLTLFIMKPVLGEVKTTAYDPYKAGEIESSEFFTRALVPMKEFMLRQTQIKDLNLFLDIGGFEELPSQSAATLEGLKELSSDIGIEVIVPAFVTSELKRAFTMGFLLFLPFLVIDMVVSSVLMSMGMVMLPPAMIALPFKLMMFVLIDGWGMMFGTLAKSFR